MSQPLGEFTLLQEEEEVLGEPTFELWVRDGEPVVSGCYFMHPPLVAVHAEWDPAHPHRVVVNADDGSEWFAENVPLDRSVSVQLRPALGTHPRLRTRPSDDRDSPEED